MDDTELQALVDLSQRLHDWDWQAALVREERSIRWLARKTGMANRTVYGYKYGESKPTTDWLVRAYLALKGRA